MREYIFDWRRINVNLFLFLEETKAERDKGRVVRGVVIL